MTGSPERGNPHDPFSNLAGAEDQGGFEESALIPAQKISGDGFGLPRVHSSYVQSRGTGKPKAAFFAHDERGDSGQKTPNFDAHAHALLGIKARTPASLEPRGFQRFLGASEKTFAVFTMGYPTGVLSYKAVDFDPFEYRADPAGYLDRIEAGLPEGSYLIGVERRGGRL